MSVLCVGHASYDISTLVADYPAEDSKCEVQTLMEAGGGPAANAAYLLARWGVPTALAALVGDDRYGRQIVQELEQAGVDASLVEVRPNHVTPVSIIVVNTKSGSRTIINRKAPKQELAPAPERFAGLRPRAMLFDGHELEASLAALAALPGARTVLDAGSLRPGTETLAGKVEFLVASERFARQVTGEVALATPDAQRRCVADLRHRYGNTVVVTLGRRGLVFDDGGGFRAMPAFPAVAVDTTGAGDIFHGAFVFGLLEGMDLWDTLRLASMAAAISVTREGGRLSTPALAEVRGLWKMLDESALAQGSLIVVGNINRDVKTSPICGGAAILSDGETAAESITETIGGGGANAAFAAAALGGRVAFLGKVGDDDLGRRLLARLEKSGILARLAFDRDNPTGTSIALAFDSGQRHFISHLPSSRTLRFEDLDLASGCGAGVPPACGEGILPSCVAGVSPAFLPFLAVSSSEQQQQRQDRGQDARGTRGRDALVTRGQNVRVTASDLSGFAHLLRADIWFSEPMLFGGNEKLFQWARGRNIPVSMDLNWAPLWGRGDEGEINRRKQAALDVLPLVTIAHGNVRELCACTRTDDLESALRRLERCGAPAVLVHMGEKGAGYYSGGKLEVVPATPARRRLHATGTGDVLSVCAMLLHARQDVPVTERLKLANQIVTEFIEGKRTLIPAL